MTTHRSHTAARTTRSTSGPIRSVISSDSSGLANLRNRRGVTPFVTFVKRPGYNSAKSGRTRSRSSLLCSSATPLTLLLPTVAR